MNEQAKILNALVTGKNFVYKDLNKIQDSRISCQLLRILNKLKELKGE